MASASFSSTYDICTQCTCNKPYMFLFSAGAEGGEILFRNM